MQCMHWMLVCIVIRFEKLDGPFSAVFLEQRIYLCWRDSHFLLFRYFCHMASLQINKLLCFFWQTGFDIKNNCNWLGFFGSAVFLNGSFSSIFPRLLLLLTMCPRPLLSSLKIYDFLACFKTMAFKSNLGSIPCFHVLYESSAL